MKISLTSSDTDGYGITIFAVI